MLIDITKNILAEHTNINNPVILAPTANIKHYFLTQSKLVFPENASDQIRTKHLFDVCDVSITDHYTLHSPCIGAPIITFILEPLLQLGVKDVFLFSICGGIRGANSPNLSIGDYIIPTSAICDEGTSPHYGSSELIKYSWPTTQQMVVDILSQSTNHGVYMGPIWTTDAIYKETRERVHEYAIKGAIGVDMEMSAVLHLCNIYGANLTSLFVVSDLAGDDFQLGLSRSSFHESMNKGANILAQVVRKL